MKKLMLGMMCLLLSMQSIQVLGANGYIGSTSDPDKNGSADHPYLIEDLADFEEFCSDSSYWASGLYIRLDCDLDLDGIGDNFTSGHFTTALIASATTIFEGDFDGNDHAIKNITIITNSTAPGGSGDYAALFARAWCNSIHDLDVININISNAGGSIGGLCGALLGGTIDNCYVSGHIQANNGHVGGLCGHLSQDQTTFPAKLIQNSHADVEVIAPGTAGGLCGCNDNGTITNCYATGDIYATGAQTSCFGGFCGFNGDSTNSIIEKSYSTGNVYSSAIGVIGGFCGNNHGQIEQCFSTGNVEGHRDLGGFSGSSQGTIKDCFCTGNVSGIPEGNYLGGFTGAGDHFTNCYSTGKVNYVGSYLLTYGGFSGSGGTATACFWNKTTSEITEANPNATGKTTAEMSVSSTFTAIGVDWDFADTGEDGDPPVWKMSASTSIYQGFPILDWMTDELSVNITGSGNTSDNPYVIDSLSDFLSFADSANASTYWSTNKYISLECDLDFSSLGTFTEAVIAPDTDSTNGYDTFDGSLFDAHFNGNGHTIFNLSISGDYFNGLFGKIGANGHVSNITLYNVNIVGDAHSGGISGYNQGEIEYCNVIGTLESTESYIGGICGKNDSGSIEHCSTSGSVEGYQYVGGITGFGHSSSIGYCRSSMTIDGHSYAGGIVGQNYATGSIYDCIATGDVTSIGGDTGGLCGAIYQNQVTNCCATGNVSGYQCNGGLVGYSNVSQISDCYSSGSVSGTQNYAGFCGYQIGSSASMEDCIWDTTTSGLLIGYNLDTSTPGTVTNVLGKTTSEMQEASTFTASGWSFTTTWEISDSASPFNGRPVLKTFESDLLTGSGTSNDPYQIRSLEDFVIFTSHSWFWQSGIYTTLYCDLDLSSLGTISETLVDNYSGNFNGNSHTISNLAIVGRSYCGLFGTISSEGSVNNLTFNSADITGSYGVGILCGINYGDITNCSVDGEVKGKALVGGLVGFNRTGNISDCISDATVTGHYFNTTILGGCLMGGLCGHNHEGSIYRCSASSTVTSSDRYNFSHTFVGGLCGYLSGVNASIKQCYATGDVTAKNYVGGFLGTTHGYISNEGYCTVEDCYATGDVSVEDLTNLTSEKANYGGGFCGMNYTIISKCYSTGSVDWVDDDHAITDHIGGFCGSNAGPPSTHIGSITSCKWYDTCTETVSAIGNASGTYNDVTTLSYLQMMQISYFSDWDFVNVWTMPVSDYPKLDWEGALIYPLDDNYDDEIVKELYQRHNGELSDGAFDYTSDHIADGIISGALTFDSSVTNYEDFIEIGDADDFGLTGNGSRTVMAWVKPDSSIVNGGIVCWSSIEDSDTGESFIIFVQSSTGTTKTLQFSAGGDQKVISSVDLCDGKWHHIAVVFDTSNSITTVNSIKLYIDGNEDTNVTRVGSTGLDTTNGPVYIGKMYYKNTYLQEPYITYFDGLIDDVRIYDYALSEDAIDEQISVFSDLVLYYDIDNNSGSTVNDMSANNHTGYRNSCSYSTGNNIYLQLNGNSDNYVGTNYDGISGSNARTVSAWVKTADHTSETSRDTETLVHWGDSDTSGGCWFVGIHTYNQTDVDDNNNPHADGALMLYTRSGKVVSTTNVTDGEWHHVAVVLEDGDSNITDVKFYVDGVLETSKTIDIYEDDGDIDTDTSNSVDHVRIGKFYTSNYFTGNIDQIKIYSAGLDAATIERMAIYSIPE